MIKKQGKFSRLVDLNSEKIYLVSLSHSIYKKRLRPDQRMIVIEVPG